MRLFARIQVAKGRRRALSRIPRGPREVRRTKVPRAPRGGRGQKNKQAEVETHYQVMKVVDVQVLKKAEESSDRRQPRQKLGRSASTRSFDYCTHN